MGRPGQRRGALQLLVGDEHHHVPGAEPQEGGDEPAPGKAVLEGDIVGNIPTVPKALPGAPVATHGLGHLGCAGRCRGAKRSRSMPVSVHVVAPSLPVLSGESLNSHPL